MKSTQNVLLICKSLPWRFTGGIQTHTWELAQALTNQNQQVTILTGGAFSKPQKVYRKNDVKIIEIPFFPGRYIKPISHISEEFSFNWQVKKWVARHHEDYDVIHSQGRSGYLLALNSKLRQKLVTTFHGLITKEISNNKWYDFNGKIHAVITRLFERMLVRKSVKTIAVSNSLINDLKESNEGVKNISLIPNGVKTQRFTVDATSGRQNAFLFIGRLHPVKSLDKLIKEFHHSHSDITLDIIGDGPAFKALQLQVSELGFEERIRFLGSLENEVIMPLISSYRALVLPSSYETQGIVLLEANAQAVPVIASDLPAIRESVTHNYNGLLCNPQDGKQFIQAMNFLATDPEYASKMGTRGYLHVQTNYGWDKIAERTLEVYQKVAS